MQLKTYVKDAIRTESRIEDVRSDLGNLLAVMEVYVAAGNLLDALKKNIFYNKPINIEQWDNNLSQIILETNSNVEYGDYLNNPELKEDPDNILSVDPRLFHAIIGIATESTELVEALLLAVANDTDVDHVNIREELGDLNWYQAIAIDATASDWSSILDVNIAKLKKRYPDKFSSHKAIHRDIAAEREILENGSEQQYGHAPVLANATNQTM